MHQGKEGSLQPDRPLTPPEQLQLTPEPTPEEQFLRKAHPQQQGDGIQEFSCGDLALPVALTTEQKDHNHAKEQSGRFQQAPQESAQAGRGRQDNHKRRQGCSTPQLLRRRQGRVSSSSTSAKATPARSTWSGRHWGKSNARGLELNQPSP